MQKKIVSIVGNGPLTQPEIDFIEACDIVIRFNLTPNIGNRNFKTTILYSVCNSKRLGRYIKNKEYQKHCAFINAQKVISAYSPEVIRKYMRPVSLWDKLKGTRPDWTAEYSELCKEYEKEFEYLSLKDFKAACQRLAISGHHKDFIPSTGFLAILKSLEAYPLANYEISLVGFSFQGWKKHAWEK